MKTQDDYRAAWNDLFEECNALENQRDNLEMELDEIRSRIDHLQTVLIHLRTLAGLALGDDIAGLGITDAIRAILKHSKERMSPNDVRQALAKKGFNLSAYSAPMSSIYKILARLADDSSSPVIRIRTDSGVLYEWRVPEDTFAGTEITDDDIPF